MSILKYTEHRPWKIPNKYWVMSQTWKELLFMHWEIKPDDIRPLIPKGMELDTFENKAWIAVVPFLMSNVKPRYTFSVPWISYFLELNVRTYVKIGDKAGVYFLSLEASNPLAVRIARKLFYLPYMDANMRMEKGHYYSSRTHKNQPKAEFEAIYQPVSEPFYSKKGSLEHWLTERYCLYSVDNHGNIYRGDIHHQQWSLQIGECEIIKNTMALSHGIKLPDTEPLLHYAKNLEVVVWYPVMVN